MWRFFRKRDDDHRPLSPSLIVPNNSRSTAVKFLKARVTIAGTHAEIVCDSDSDPFHSWLPNTYVEKLQLNVQPVDLATHINLCNELGDSTNSFEHTPSSYVFKAQGTQPNYVEGSCIRSAYKTRKNEASVTPWPPTDTQKHTRCICAAHRSISRNRLSSRASKVKENSATNDDVGSQEYDQGLKEEDQTAMWHGTPFEEKLDKALSQENFVSQSFDIVGKALSDLPFIEHAGEANKEMKVEEGYLPMDILNPHILGETPTIRSIIIYKMVCKLWLETFSAPEYTRDHKSRVRPALLILDSDVLSYPNLQNCMIEDFYENINSPILPIYSTLKHNGRRLEISNSCDGLVGLYNRFAEDPVIVWNPITGEYHQVPGNNGVGYDVVVALGRTQDMVKLVRICFHEFNFQAEPPASIDIHTVGTQNWRAIQGIQWGNNFVFVKSHPVHIGGNIFFLVTFEVDPPTQMRVVRFDLTDETFTTIVLPNDPNHPEPSFTHDHVSIGSIDGLLYILKCDFQGNFGIGLHHPAVFVETNVKVWVFRNAGWEPFIDNVTLFTNFKCPQIFNTPKRAGCYIIYVQASNEMLVYEGAGIALQRYRLQGARGRSYIAVQHTPVLMSMRESIGLNEIETHRGVRGITNEVILSEVQ